jgi:hypothetical protein
MATTTILIGSGATIELGACSTNDITQKITESNRYQNYVESSYFSAVDKVYNKLKETYPEVPNFEHIFHILEMLYSYNFVWKGNCKNPSMFPLFAPFVKLQTEIINNNELEWLFSLISQCQLDIMKMVNTYDDKYKNKKSKEYSWYNNFWRKFNGFNLFNLNYDTTIENSIDNYIDGFVDSGDKRFQKFNPKKLYEDKVPYKICHLHGCIQYYYHNHTNINKDVYEYGHSDLYKWTSFQDVEKMMSGSTRSNAPTQSGESIYIGPIITGLRKTDKLIATPYNYYHHFLSDSILKNKSLLIVGYSFGDLYINDLIERMNLLHRQEKRIVVITYFKPDEIKEIDGTITKTFSGLDFVNDRNKDLLFIKKMMYDDSFEFRNLDHTISKEERYISKDKTVHLYVHGFKSAAEKYSDEIVDFLTR